MLVLWQDHPETRRNVRKDSDAFSDKRCGSLQGVSDDLEEPCGPEAPIESILWLCLLSHESWPKDSEREQQLNEIRQEPRDPWARASDDGPE
jgi:hypothetical protein